MWATFRRRVDRSEDGLSIVEILLAMTLMAIAIVGLIGSANAGLRLTRTSNSRQTAVQVANKEMEHLRASAYGALGLPSGYDYASEDPSSPDARVDESFDPPRYLPPNSTVAEEIVEGGSLDHVQTLVVGARTMTIYTYITWASSDHDNKRVTLVVTSDARDARQEQTRVTVTSVFTKGSIDFRQTTLAESPLVESVSPYVAGGIFDIHVADTAGFPPDPAYFVFIDGNKFTVTDIDDDDSTVWTVVADANGPLGHTNGSPVLYVETSGLSPGGTPTTLPPGASTTTTVVTECGNDNQGPTGSLNVQAGNGLDGNRWVRARDVKLTVVANDQCQPIKVRFSNDGISYSSPVYHPLGSAEYSWAFPAEGAFTVRGIYEDGRLNSRAFTSSVSVDSINPEWPGSNSLTGNRVAVSGPNHTITLTWANDATDTNFWGWRISRTNGNSGTTDTIVVRRASASGQCAAAAANCTYADTGRTAGTSYTYVVHGIDAAGNTSGASRTVSCLGTAGTGACNV